MGLSACNIKRYHPLTQGRKSHIPICAMGIGSGDAFGNIGITQRGHRMNVRIVMVNLVIMIGMSGS